MLRRALFVSLLCSSGCSSPDPQPRAAVDSGVVDVVETGPTVAEIDTFNRVRNELETRMREQNIPGASLAVVLHGKLAFAAGLGVKREGTSDPVTEDTLFRVASMTKPLVALGVMQQVAAGKISLDAPLVDYVPEFGRATGHDPRALLVRHLLQHTSGIPDEGPKRCSTDPSYLATWLSSRNTQPYWVPPGTLFNYSNPNFTLAAMALQQASGQPFDAYLKEHVLLPAGMTTAALDPNEASVDRTTGHLRLGPNAGRLYDFGAFDCAVMRTYMGVMASAKDYAHLAEKLLARDPALVPEATLADMFGDHAATGLSPDQTIGYGFFNFDWHSHKVHSHDGRAYGWESWFGVVPEKQMAVVLLVNVDGFAPASFGLHVLDAFNHEEDQPWPDRSTPRATWAKYAGTYNDPYGQLGEVAITFRDERLFLQLAAAAEPFELGQVGGDSFGFWTDSAALSGTFFGGDSGQYSYFATRAGVAKRTGEAPAFDTKTAIAPPASDFALAISHAHRAPHFATLPR